MARMLRIEYPGAIYHVLNRGNYRKPIFKEEGARRAWLKCQAEAHAKTGWFSHAWAIMTNHYHLAQTTPQANLMEGMKWLQQTYSARFNLFRDECGRIFQGRYKALLVEPSRSLGALCHYIHLNPIRAGVITIDQLRDWPWTSFRWICHPDERPSWFNPGPALQDPCRLPDSPKGWKAYANYLGDLAGDKLEQERLGFDQMSKGWAIGSADFKKEVLSEEIARGAAIATGLVEAKEAREIIWKLELDRLIRLLGGQVQIHSSKSADWKVAIAAVMKNTTTASNGWLARELEMGSLFNVSHLVSQCRAGRRAVDAYCRLSARIKV